MRENDITGQKLMNHPEVTQLDAIDILKMSVKMYPARTEYMTIGHPRGIKQLEISDALLLNGTAVERIPKSLGIILDESLTWDEQFKAVKSKVCGGLSALKRLKNIILQSQLCSVFHAIVDSHRNYVVYSTQSWKVIFAMQMLFGGVSQKQN